MPDLEKEDINEVLTTSAAASDYDGAKLCLSLLAASTKQMIRRMGWFRNPRLAQAADSYLQRHELFKRASGKLDAGTGRTMAKPEHAEILAFEEGMKAYVAKVSTKANAPTMTVSRDISKGPMQIADVKARTKLREAQERQKELLKNPNAVKKSGLKKRKEVKPQIQQAKAASETMEEG